MNVQVLPGDCLEVLRTLAADSVDSVVTDPPYALTNNSVGNRSLIPGQYTLIGRPKEPRGGFMGKAWDTGDVAHSVEFWHEVLRVLKPGGHVLAFGGTRTSHRLACAIEDAGFEIRDSVYWTYGSGFPKSHNQGNGWGTALKPAVEPICMARKPLSESTVAANVLRWGTGAINVDGCRVPTTNGERPNGSGDRDSYRILENRTDRLPPHMGNVTPDAGRWPANLIHDGSDEVLAAFPESNSARASGNPNNPWRGTNHIATSYGLGDGKETIDYRDTGSAARFFYTAKADADDRLGSRHPTVKPVDLMQYLVRLVTPRGGTVLDPFAGTGTTGEAAIREGMRAILIEREEEYLVDIKRRMELVNESARARKVESFKARGKALSPLPLFD